MSSRSQTISNAGPSLEIDMKPVVIVPIERKRKAEHKSSQGISPLKSQKTTKTGNNASPSSSIPLKRSPPSLFTPQPIVTIIITSSTNPLLTQTFNIHQNILCYYSKYFAEELQRGDTSLGANAEPITLQDVDISSFGLFLNWIYYQKIQNEEGKIPKLIDLAKLWTLGERFDIVDLQNTTMDRLRDEILYPTQFEEFIHFAYGIEGGEMLRKLAIARLAWTLPGPFKDILRRLPAKAQMDLILELKDQRDNIPKEFWKEIGNARDFYVEERVETVSEDE